MELSRTSSTSKRNKLFTLLASAALLLWSQGSLAAIADTPLFLSQSAKPQVMLTMSNDHQMFYKAYDDYSDVDKDGVGETTYKHSVDYYGYFDSYKCYNYDTTATRFVPQAVTINKYCGGNWSGNFLNWATMSRMDTVRKILFGGKRSSDTASLTVLERAFLPHDAHAFAKFYNGTDLDKLTPFSYAQGITACNTTVSSSSTAYSQSVTDPPLMRVAAGDFRLWAANERWQCRWREEKDADNSNNSTASGLASASRNPYKTSGDTNSDGVNPDAVGQKDYIVRVEACNAALLGEEECKRYPGGNYKPVGLLQTYGDSGNILFGLISGSYTKNKSGGVLRKNISAMTNEINVTTDGTFKTAPSTGNIINVINSLRLYGYYYSDGTYNKNFSAGGDNCTWGLNSFTDGDCSNWGNPQSEIYLEALRYFAGKTAGFTCDDSTRLGGVVTATWSDPVSNSNWCAPLNIINFNASTSSYDGDSLSGASDVGIANLTAETNAIGDAENITGGEYFVGQVAGTGNQLCTGKTVTGLGEVDGTCPDAPRLDGTYQIAGLAHYARTHSVRTDLSHDEQRVMTYGVALSPAVPKLEIPVPGSTTQKVTILPACQNTDVGGNCAIVDFKIVTPHAEASGIGTGKVYVNWEDSEQGGDYDQDMWGTLEYTITSSDITVTTDVQAESTSYDMGFGYVISGTTQDGFHAHSGIEGYNYSDPYAGVLGCSNCQVGDAATSETYTLGASATNLLEQPLFYAAKWGGFDEDKKTANNILDKTSEWDANGDGIPDKYFYATNPSELATSLEKVFLSVAAAKSSSASIVADSVTLETGTHIYQAQFDSSNWTGTVQSFPLDLQGNIGAPEWSAATSVDAINYNTRVVLTHNGTTGTAFRWTGTNTLSATQKTLMNIDPATATADTKGEDRLNFIRGDTSKELRFGVGTFRNRDSLLGDIVSSTPYYVSKVPAFNYPDTLIDETDSTTYYSAFRDGIQALNSDAGRWPMLYVGANDGMLHAIRADTGAEVFAYVPSTVIAKLPQLSQITYAHKYFVDGAPTSGDAYGSFSGCTTAPCWRTVLVGGLSAGGKGIYALDVTDPSQVTEAYPTKHVLWEKSSSSTGFADLGFTFSQPAIVRMANGTWAAVFGNGYGSTNGRAVLYIVNIATGANIVTPIILEQTLGSNGLSTVAPVDVDGNRTIDYIYAGDLQGNLWKVDVSSSNTSQWKTAFGTASTPRPLFVAKDNQTTPVRQPITAQPEVSLHPTGTGYMIYFGTGKYFETGDNNPTGAQLQTFYGIWDKNDGTYGFTRTDLLQQTIDYQTVQHGFGLRVTSNHDINWRPGTTTPDHMGWYMNLIDPSNSIPGERVIHQAFLRSGRIVFTTLIPSLHACDYGGTGWLMELDATDGSRLEVTPWDLTHDGLFNSDDYVTMPDGSKVPASGKKSEVGIIQKPTVISAGSKEYKYASGSKDAAIEMTVESTSNANKGRTSWRQIR